MNTSSADKTTSDKLVPLNWTKVDDAHSNELIDAYLKGVEYGREEKSRILINQFKKNLSQAASLCENLLAEVSKKDIELDGIHLKADGISSFTALFLTSVDNFVSESFRKVYTIAHELKQKNVNDDFYISFSFMPNSNNLNTHCLSADGFFMTYDKKGRPTVAARPA